MSGGIYGYIVGIVVLGGFMFFIGLLWFDIKVEVWN